jgi:hypothetical protein
MHSFEVSLGMKALMKRASLKMYFGQRFHTPMKLQKNADYLLLEITTPLIVYI